MRELKTALALEPNNSEDAAAESVTAISSPDASRRQGRFWRGSSRWIRSRRYTRCMPGFAEIMEGNFEAAIEPYRQMFELDPTNPMARLFFIWVLILNRRHDEVDALLKLLPAPQRHTLPARLTFFLGQRGRRAVAGSPGRTDLRGDGCGARNGTFSRAFWQRVLQCSANRHSRFIG